MKKVVVIAYAFPPVGGAGVQRPAKFVKYLREFGWEPLVLTAANPSVPIIDDSLLKDIPPGVKIFKARTLEPSYGSKQQYAATGGGGGYSVRGWIKKVVTRCLLPDTQILWWPGMVWTLIEVVRQEKPACLFVTAPPFSSFIPVVAVGKLYGVPVVIDFRDEWSFSRRQWENAVKTPLAFRIDTILERFAVANCRQFTAANASYVASLRAEYPDISRDKGEVITNGYDADDFVGIARNSGNSDLVRFIYAGTVWNATSLETCVTALKRLVKQQPDLACRLTVKIYGRIVGVHAEYLHDPVLKGIVELCGYMEHSQIIQQICNADVLLLTLADLPGAEKIIAGKVFECMATGKHIFAIVPPGETREILQENYNKMTVSDFGNTEDIYNGLVWIMTHLEIVRDNAAVQIDQFSRIRLAEKLASTLSGALQGSDR